MYHNYLKIKNLKILNITTFIAFVKFPWDLVLYTIDCSLLQSEKCPPIKDNFIKYLIRLDNIVIASSRQLHLTSAVCIPRL